MSLAARSESWVRAGLLSVPQREGILGFEEARRKRIAQLALASIGYPLLILGACLAFYAARSSYPGLLGTLLDSVATVAVAIGCFLVIMRRLVVAEAPGFAMSMAAFHVGAILMVAALFVGRLEPYRLLLLWAALIVFSSFLAQKRFKRLFAAHGLFGAGLLAVNIFLGDDPTITPYTKVGLAVAIVVPSTILVETCLRWLGKLWRTKLAHAFRWVIESVVALWKTHRPAVQAALKWTGRVRLILLEYIAAVALGALVREHFPLLNALLWDNKLIYGACALMTWGVFASLIPKEKPRFSMIFSAIGSLEILGRFVLGPAVSPDAMPLLVLVIPGLLFVAWTARKLTNGERTTDELLGLGALGWATAAFLIAMS